MDRGACEENAALLCTAYQGHISSDSSFAMIGWLDSDGDGIFDVLDVQSRRLNEEKTLASLSLSSALVGPMLGHVNEEVTHSAIGTVSSPVL